MTKLIILAIVIAVAEIPGSKEPGIICVMLFSQNLF